jgi:L,D-transpeptidase ErfK/SrfK
MGFQWLRGAVMAATLLAGTAQAAERNDIIGELKTHTAQWEDMFVEIMRANDVGYNELLAANPGVDPWVPGVGTHILLPTAHILPDAPHRGIVINLPEMRMYYFAPNGEIVTHAIGIGEEGWATPKGSTTIVRKQANPAWYPPASIRAEKPELPPMVPAGPDNPLGDHAMYLGWNAFLIHGTNKPDGVGRRASHGCIRMFPEGINDMFRRVAVGTPVTAVDQPVKLGWRGGELYLEVHHTLANQNALENEEQFTPEPLPDLRQRVTKAAGKDANRIDWALVEQVGAQRLGVPIRITLPIDRTADQSPQTQAVPAQQAPVQVTPAPAKPRPASAVPQQQSQQPFDFDAWQRTPIVRWR